MSITPTTVEDFAEEFYAFMEDREGSEPSVYLDTENIPTIGVGFAFFNKAGTSFSVRSDINTAFSGIHTFTLDEIALLDDMASYLSDSNAAAAQTAFDNRSSGILDFTIDNTERRSLFDYGVDDTLAVVREGPQGEIFEAFEASHAGSKELQAVYSLVYNAPALFGAGLADAIASGDRARAWYEILYNHESHDVEGLMNRREAEADLFGLINGGATAYEVALELNTLFNGQDNSSNDIYERIQERDTYKPFEEKVLDYLVIVQDEYTGGAPIDYIQVVDGTWVQDGILEAKAAAGKTDADTVNLMIGGDGADIIYAKGGDDFIFGGGGINYLDGGEGADTYVIAPGSTTYVEDTGTDDADDKIVIAGIDAEDVKLMMRGGDLEIWDFSNPSEARLISVLPNHFNSEGEKVDTIEITAEGEPIIVELGGLTSADFAKTPVITLPDIFGNGVDPNQVFRPDFISVMNVGFWDPLVIDLDDDGFAQDAVGFEQYFDLGGDGFAELTAWTGDAFLVRDLNDNGRIDNGTEMFGTATQDGFTVLGTFDLNADGVINSSDAVWSDLLLWHDLNGDAQTQSDELLTLSSQNITAFQLSSVEIVPPGAQALGNGVLLTHTGTVATTTGTLDIGNLIFSTNEQNSRYAEDYTLDLRVLGLPNLIGHARYADLHVAMSLDNDTEDPDSLLSIMQDIASYSFLDAMENYGDVKDKVAALLFRWMGVDDVDPESRGPFLEDGRIVDFVLAMLNGEFVDPTTGSTEVGSVQARGMTDLWDTLLRQFTAKILFQSIGHEMFGSSVTFDFFTESLDGTFALSQDAVDALEAHATGLANTAEREAFWVNALTYIYDVQTARYEGETGAFGDLTSTEETMLNDAIEASDGDLTWYSENHNPTGYPVSIEHRVFSPVGSLIEGDNTANISASDPSVDGTTADDTMYGYGGNDILNGHAGNDVIYGGDGNDELIGEGGSDILYGGAGNDILNPGVGANGFADMIFGEAGNDTLYVGGNGQVIADGGEGDDLFYVQQGAWITDSDGDDTVHFYNTGLVSQILWKRYADDTLHLNRGGENVYLRDFFNHDVVPFETLTVQGDATVVDLTALTQQITTYGTAAGEEIDGIEVGASNIDTIYAGAGNDIISSGSGNDTVYGEDGADIIDGGSGDDSLTGGGGYDIYVASAGTDTIYATADGLSFTNGTLFGDLEFERLLADNDRLRLTHETGSLIIELQFAGGKIADLRFGDGFAINMSDVSITTKGTSSNDTINGVTTGGSPHDIIYAYAGNDTVNSSDGDDVIYAGDGNDTVDASTGDDYVEGGSGDDTIKGKSGSDTLNGGDGDDYVYGYDSTGSADAGSDSLYGGAGNDALYGWSGSDVLDGGDGNDTLTGYAGNDTYHYSGGLDTMSETGGTDTLVFASSIHVDDLTFAKSGFNAKIILSSGTHEITTDARFSSFYSSDVYKIDTLQFHDGFTLNWLYYWYSNTGLWNEGISTGDTYENTLLGQSGNDTIDALGGDDTVHGRAGNDTIYGGSGTDRLHGGDGDDVIHGGSGNDTIWGGEGTDTLSFANSTALVSASLVAGTASGEGSDTFSGIENITGSAYADSLTGDGNANILTGNAGDDALTGNAGNDTLEGGTGNDTLDGGDGIDTVRYNAAASGVTVNLSTGAASGGDGTDTLTGIENIHGSANADTLTGDGAANVIVANAGDDTITGNAGDDSLYGGDGGDTLYGNDGADTLYGEVGNDYLWGHAGNDTIYGGAGVDSINGLENDDILYGGDDGDTLYGDANSLDETTYAYSGADTLYGEGGNDQLRAGKGADDLHGGDGNDTLYGGSGADTLYGDAGDDTLYGDSGLTYTGDTGNDTLNGGAGNDTLYGQSGDDTLWAGEGSDYLYGGTGTNIFAAYNKAGNDNDLAFVQDWSTGSSNKIDLSDLLAEYDAGTDTLSDFVNVAVGSNTTFQVDRDGTGTTYGWDNVIRLTGISTFETNENTLVSNGTLLVA